MTSGVDAHAAARAFAVEDALTAAARVRGTETGQATQARTASRIGRTGLLAAAVEATRAGPALAVELADRGGVGKQLADP